MTPDPEADYATRADVAPPGRDDDGGRDRIKEEPTSSENGLQPDHGDTGTAMTSSDIMADLAALEGLTLSFYNDDTNRTYVADAAAAASSSKAPADVVRQRGGGTRSVRERACCGTAALGGRHRRCRLPARGIAQHRVGGAAPAAICS